MNHARIIGSALLLPLLAAAQDAPAPGSVKGELTSSERLITRGPLSQAEVVLYLEPAKPAGKTAGEPAEKPAAKPGDEPQEGPRKPATATVNQRKLQFVPRVLAIRTGTVVTFLNEDRVTHNVFLDTDCCKLDADMEKGEKKVQTFATAGTFPVVCRLHPEMSMTIVAVDSPWFTVAKWRKSKTRNAAGKRFYRLSFELPDVPAGKYVLRSWNKKLAALAHPVEVVAGEAADVVLELTR
ncbi:MAG: hypothetical protein KAI24_17830 [Planctomycetes bacterium]|nr:hypothetical protein [Planctomycetota bacterium]